MKKVMKSAMMAGGKTGSKVALARVGVFLFVLSSIPHASVIRAQRATGYTSTATTSFAITIHVQPNGDDARDGLSYPTAVRTIAKGIALAKPQLQQGKATRISIYPGLYREGNLELNAGLTGGSARSTPFTIEGTEKGKIVISGSVTRGWEPATWTLYDREFLVYQHAWPYSWGFSGCPPNDPYPELLQRKEMIIYNGSLLKQWLKYAVSVDSTLMPNSFFVDTNARKVYIRLERPMAPGDLIEVPDKEILLLIEQKENFTLRNIAFTHANSYVWSNNVWGRAVAIFPGRYTLVEDCDFRMNNGTGADLGSALSSTFRGCRFSSNGWKGLGMAAAGNVLLESCHADSNSWRQNWAHHLGLDAAGIKVTVSNRVTFYKCVCLFNNPSEGIWIDYDNRNITFECCSLPPAPHGAPILVEASPGPTTVSKSTVGMVAIVGGADVTVDSCILTVPLSVSEQNRRQVGAWTAINERFSIYHSTLQAGGRAIDASLPLDLWQRFLRSLESDSNSWISGGTERCFSDADNKSITFTQWQALGKDVHSVFLSGTETRPPPLAWYVPSGSAARLRDDGLEFRLDGRYVGRTSRADGGAPVDQSARVRPTMIHIHTVAGAASKRIPKE